MTDLTSIPLLRPAIFPQVPPFLNFLRGEQEYSKWLELELVWHQRTPCRNPLLVSCVTRAGLVPCLIPSPHYRGLAGLVWDQADPRTRYLLYTAQTGSPAMATRLLGRTASGADLLHIHPEGKINRLAGFEVLCRKDLLARQCRARTAVGLPAFLPESFSLPEQESEAAGRVGRGEAEGELWIWKPGGLAGGAGIQLVSSRAALAGLQSGGHAVLQRYIQQPLLLAGHKCDLRLYILVTDGDPLTAYIFTQGRKQLLTCHYKMKAVRRMIVWY